MHFRGDWNDYNSGSLMQKRERKNPQTSQLQIKLMQSEVNRVGNMFFFFLIEKCIYLIPECYTGAPFMWWCHCRENNS